MVQDSPQEVSHQLEMEVFLLLDLLLVQLQEKEDYQNQPIMLQVEIPVNLLVVVLEVMHLRVQELAEVVQEPEQQVLQVVHIQEPEELGELV